MGDKFRDAVNQEVGYFMNAHRDDLSEILQEVGRLVAPIVQDVVDHKLRLQLGAVEAYEREAVISWLRLAAGALKCLLHGKRDVDFQRIYDGLVKVAWELERRQCSQERTELPAVIVIEQEDEQS